MKPIALGWDPNAKEMRDAVKSVLTELGHEVEDYGSEDPIYANVAIRVAEAVASGKHERGILICGTGIGMSIAANKVHGAYAALVSDAYSAERAALSNDANIITLGAQTLGIEHAKVLVKVWMSNYYKPGGRSEPKVSRIKEYDKERGNVRKKG
ncbi:MAG: RpiB/LacA/LacB family sugar-phosphate isomerase [Spirochaetales bacterium]